MKDCNFQPLLTAYHDDELDAAARIYVATHVKGCLACAGELRQIRQLSSSIAAATHENKISVDRAIIIGMHRAVERAAREDLARRPIWRAASMIGALAASVLIVGGAWLLDTQKDARSMSHGRGISQRCTTIAPEWERLAVSLEAHPRPGIAGDSPLAPHYADAIHWMLDGLLPSDRRTEAKPWTDRKSF